MSASTLSNSVVRFAARLARCADLAGAGIFAVLFLALVVQVVRRFVFGAPAAWTEELATIAFVWVIFWGTAFAVPLSTHVAVEVPPPPPPQSSKLSQCDFPNEKKPWRVDNTCKAILDDVAQNLLHNPDSKLVIVGNAEPTEKLKNLAAERAVNSKAYLSGGEAKQGIDPSRMEVRTGGAGTKTAEYWVVPAGANFAGEGTQAVDESKVKAVPDHPASAKKAAKPMAQ